MELLRLPVLFGLSHFGLFGLSYLGLSLCGHSHPRLIKTARRFWAPVLSLLSVCLVSVGAQAAPSPEIDIEGGPKALETNIRHFLHIADEGCSTPLWHLRALESELRQDVQQASQALGYYSLEFEAEFAASAECWSLKLKLTPGKPIKIKQVRIQINGDGAGDSIFQALLAKPGIAKGDQLNHERYEQLKAKFSSLAASHGYFDASFSFAQVAVSRAKNSANIHLVFETGVRYKLGKIHIQHDILDDAFLARYLNIAEGDDYDADKLLELKNAFNASNYFVNASAAPNMQMAKDGRVPIDIHLETRKRRAYSIGAGADTDTRGRILLGYEDRYINGRGHKFNADLTLSETKRTVSAVYTIPMHRPAQEYLKLYTGNEWELKDSGETNKNTYGTSYTLYQENQWLQTYALNYEREDSRTGSDPTRTTNLIIPSVSISRTYTDGKPYSRFGWSFLSKLSGSPQTLGSDFSFVQFYARYKRIHALGPGRVLWRTELGATNTQDVEDLPLSVRFFAGGDQSIRGYAYDSLGPTDAEGQVIGGKNMLVTSLEYDYRFTDTDWAIAAFTDLGNTSDDWGFEFEQSAGVGVRWISPIGPVRVDIAKPISNEKGWRLHISMGPDL